MTLAERRYTIAIDTRESLPYAFEGVTCQSATLVAGDYSIIGMEAVVSVERKSFADFYGCLTDGRERFENSLHRLAAVRYPLVVVEASMRNLLEKYTYVAGGLEYSSQVDPLIAQNSLLSWQARYRIPFLLCGGQSAELLAAQGVASAEKAAAAQAKSIAERMTLQHFDVVWRLEHEDASQNRREQRAAR